MEKYIFLDIDGVIATDESIEKGIWGLTPRCQELLREIIDKTDAKIVITSSWRKNTLEGTIDYFQSKGFKFCNRIIGITIRAYHYITREERVHLSIPRGVEIKQWIDTHIHSNNGKDWAKRQLNKDYTYVILDDDSDMLLEHKDYFIQTDSMKGLQDEDVILAINILNNK
jgi:hypothetical protein